MQAIDLKTQLSYLKNLKNLFSERVGKEIAEEIMSKSVYLFSIGSNDYASLLNTNSSSVLLPGDHQGFVDTVIGNLTEVITVRTNFNLNIFLRNYLFYILFN